MARLSILDRFRPVGAPGPAGPVGVPAADDRGAAAELAAVFAAVAPDVQFCLDLVDEAHRKAEKRLARAREQAVARVAEARLAAAEVRASAASRVEQIASEQDARMLQQSADEAAELQKIRAARVSALARSIVDELLSEQLGWLP
jgi:vacuolar-type H+-ATPase subunit H